MLNDEIKERLKEAYNKHAHIREKNEMQPWKNIPREKFLELLRVEN